MKKVLHIIIILLCAVLVVAGAVSALISASAINLAFNIGGDLGSWILAVGGFFALFTLCILISIPYVYTTLTDKLDNPYKGKHCGKRNKND